ncbi:NAD(P)H-binding protein [Mucilaginibacter terrae]|uniref:NAD(P)H-binding protein n=1 Tax=Mucilaginibacter terrae TaxID=1955052 RepID=UPI00363E4F8C
MKIIITGSLGNVSKPLVNDLLEKGHRVTLITSDPEKRNEIEASGATAAIGSVEDADFLSSAFVGNDALYAMLPPNFKTADSRAFYQKVGKNYARAIKSSGIKRVVHLSSWGADLDSGTGFILGSHDVEQLLNALPDI